MAGRIVVGIDGSQQSGHALEWAVARARLGGEQLGLLHAYSFTPDPNFYGYHGPVSQPVDWHIEFSEHVLEAAAARVCPVVVLGEDEFPTTGPIVVGVDGSEFGTNALRYAIAEAAVRKTSVRAVAAYDVLHPAFRDDPELLARMGAGVEAEAAGAITRALDEVTGTDPASVSVDHVAVEGPATEAILGHAEDAQLIVVGTHGKGLVRRILLGSVSRQVLNDANRPVAVVDLPDT